MGISGPRSLPGEWVYQGGGTTPKLVTPSGGHHTYSQQVGGTHPTGTFFVLIHTYPVNTS